MELNLLLIEKTLNQDQSYIFFFNAIFQIVKFDPFKRPFFQITFLCFMSYVNAVYQTLDPEKMAIYSKRLYNYYFTFIFNRKS